MLASSLSVAFLQCCHCFVLHQAVAVVASVEPTVWIRSSAALIDILYFIGRVKISQTSSTSPIFQSHLACGLFLQTFEK